MVLGPAGIRYLAEERVEGDDPLAHFSSTRVAAPPAGPTASATWRTSWSGSFYDPAIEEGCAFEELISFHGGLGGPQTRPFILAPVELPLPEGPIIGAAEVHELLRGWRKTLQGEYAYGLPPGP